MLTFRSGVQFLGVLAWGVLGLGFREATIQGGHIRRRKGPKLETVTRKAENQKILSSASFASVGEALRWKVSRKAEASRGSFRIGGPGPLVPQRAGPLV